MSFYSTLEIESEENPLISFIGGGGKTSSMFQLAKELKKQGKKVLVTTTTAIYKPTKDQYDYLMLTEEDNIEENNIEEKLNDYSALSGITVIGGRVNTEGKMFAPEVSLIEKLKEKKYFDVIILEADGAKKLPLKAPANHEPVIPKGTSIVVAVMGIEALEGRPIEEIVHRWERFCQITGSKAYEKVQEDHIIKLITHEEGSFKGVIDQVNIKKYLLINKVDHHQRRRLALSIIKRIEQEVFFLEGVIIASIMGQQFELKRFVKR
ncbi:selenium cofactor biosynthesis protein YqeC [Alkaliphilus transvaalensis]|uniref:selenium cofactor biosynthesis protein YqeC n=1 Tax=Alkaliphilus transvaalensis TaxID=114628 RepID=UPI0006855C83|nr:selenium cofactor biosynthesis protein YqeC [Alkaliphilus transvaalensis]